VRRDCGDVTVLSWRGVGVVQAVHAKLIDDFNADFFSAANSSYDNGLMTTYTLPLHLGIVPAASKAQVQKNLLDLVTTTYKGKWRQQRCGVVRLSS
jgi:hypothetical protein